MERLALGAIDIAKRHTTRKKHVDVGLRVADYPTIQDYVGEAVMDTNASRLFTLSVAQAMDGATENNTVNPRPGELARGNFLHWAWQIKFEAAKNTAHVVDKMLHACGGSGYKRDMELERYLRDAKAGWVMGPTNEVLRQFVGKAVLLGFESLDYWNQSYNRRAVENEVKKLDAAGKRASRTAVQGGRRAGVEGTGGQGLRLMAILSGRRSLTVPGLRPDPFLERYWVRPGRAGARLEGDDRVTIRDPDGGQVAEVTALAPDWLEDAAASARADAPATVLRSSIGSGADGAADAIDALAGHGLDPTGTTAVRLFGEWSPAGSAHSFTAERPVVVVIAAPEGASVLEGACRHRISTWRCVGPVLGRTESWSSSPARGTTPGLPGRPGDGPVLRGQGRRVHPIIDVEGKQCSDFLVPSEEARGRDRARLRPDDHPHADGQRVPATGSLLEVLRPRHGRARGGRPRHGRPARLVPPGLHVPVLREPRLLRAHELHRQLQPTARDVRDRSA